AETAHLVFKQVTQRFDEFERHPFRKPTDVVMALDQAAADAGLDDVGVDRTLHEIAHVADAAGFLLEYPDELFSNDTPLVLRIRDARQLPEESGRRIDVPKVRTKPFAESSLDPLGLSGAHQPGVHKDRMQAITYGPMHQRGGHGGIHTARQTAYDRSRFARGRADCRDLLVDEAFHGPV